MHVDTRSAWADESFDEAAEGDKHKGGVYVVCAAMFEVNVDHAREVMLSLRDKKSRDKLHWSKMPAEQRRKAAEAVAALGGINVVAVSSPVPHRKQERARAACLKALVQELHGWGTTYLCLESRTDINDARDLELVRIVRRTLLPKGAEFYVEHKRGTDEPLLWVADIVAGAYRSHRQGRESEYREVLGDLIYDVEVPSGC